MTVPFVHLRLHSEYSLVDGLVKLKSLVSTTAERGMPALALTDDAQPNALLVQIGDLASEIETQKAHQVVDLGLRALRCRTHEANLRDRCDQLENWARISP